MKKIITLIFCTVFLFGCVTVPDGAKNWAMSNGYIAKSELPQWAKDNGYIQESELDAWAVSHGYVRVAEVVPPEPKHPLLPHPVIPALSTDPSVISLAKNMVIQDGVIDSFKLLVEIYERMYVNTDLKYSYEEFANKSLEELKKQYFDSLALTERSAQGMKR